MKFSLPSLLRSLALAGAVSAVLQGADNEAPLDVDQAIRLALSKNYAIRIESLGRPIAQAQLTQAYGRFDVQLKGGYTSSRDEQPKGLAPDFILRLPSDVTEVDVYNVAVEGSLPFGLGYSLGGKAVNTRGTDNAFRDNYNSFAGLSLSLPLLRDGGYAPSMYGIRVARANRQISDWEYRREIINTVTDVIQAFSELHFAQARLRSARRSWELAAQLQKENERRFSVGERSEYEIISAKARVASREEAIISATRHVTLVENALRQLISDNNRPELLKGPIHIGALRLDPAAKADVAADFQTALQNRPDYQLAVLALRKGRLEKGYQRNQMLPKVDLVGSYGYNGLGSNEARARSDVKSWDNASYSAGVVVNVPLTSATERGRYRSAKLRLAQAELSIQKMEQDIVVAVGNAANQVENARERMDSTRRAREFNEQTLEAEIKRLRAGTGSTFSVLYQQEQLNGAEISEALAESDYSKALAEYERQLGRTLQTYHISIDSSDKS